MRLFPNEESRSAEVRQNLAREFDFASRLFDFWLGLDKGPVLDAKLIPQSINFVIKALDTQMLRQFRSMYENCQRCEAGGASIMSRSLYETSLAMFFTLKPEVYIALLPKTDGKGQTKYRAEVSTKPSDRLSEEMRANLYIASSHIHTERFIERSVADPEFEATGRHLESVVAGLDPEPLEDLYRRIGPEWMYVLRNNRHQSYSGLSVSELATAVDPGAAKWYRFIYFSQCPETHSANAMSCLDGNLFLATTTPRYLSSDDETRRVFMASTRLFLLCASKLQEWIDFSPDVQAKIVRFEKECEAIDGEAP